jgi:hypothetical protein
MRMIRGGAGRPRRCQAIDRLQANADLRAHQGLLRHMHADAARRHLQSQKLSCTFACLTDLQAAAARALFKQRAWVAHRQTRNSTT